jgi:hypothetical protein
VIEIRVHTFPSSGAFCHRKLSDMTGSLVARFFCIMRNHRMKIGENGKVGRDIRPSGSATRSNQQNLEQKCTQKYPAFP